MKMTKMAKSLTPGKVMVGLGVTAATAAMFAMTPAIKNMANNMKSNNNKVDENPDNF
ncbi:MAG: hypothetical protein SA378_00320 [Sedimentibacter sp.]|uniref:hypothetical protein n=1 Tax=Sedimentibacter sp. TaxID=1960295 RepID=UPI002980ED99|nr:hypothetical protein [Sedimentibacter sp.]MDW5298575.1 hypothetical protein [Sedimentibacter sp.]